MRDTARAERQYHVTAFRRCSGLASCFLQGTDMASRFAAQFLDGFHNAFSSDTRNRWLAGRVDVENEDAVGVGESGAELLQQVAGAGVAVRLEDYMNTLEGALARRSQRGANLRGMMAVVVDHADVGDPTSQLET